MNITTMSEAISAYDAMLDEVYGTEILGSYAASDVFRRIDPIAYRVGFHDWADSEDIDTDGLEDDEDLP